MRGRERKRERERGRERESSQRKREIQSKGIVDETTERRERQKEKRGSK